MANRSVNRVILLGFLGADAETKFTPSGTSVTSFNVATARSWKDQQSNEWKEETTWTRVVAWRQEKLANFLTKGKQVYVEGRLQTRSYDDKDGKKVYITEVVSDEIILLGGQGSSDSPDSNKYAKDKAEFGRATAPAGKKAAADDFRMGVSEDDIAF